MPCKQVIWFLPDIPQSVQRFLSGIQTGEGGRKGKRKCAVAHFLSLSGGGVGRLGSHVELDQSALRR